MTLALTIIADVVSPRERGKYQGYFGAVFALSSVGGPLLGGFFVDQLSWRWVFYINLPIGILALVVTSIVLDLPFRRQEHKIDYPGAALLVGGVSALLLVIVWGGSEFAWSSPIIVGLSVAAAVLLTVFVWWERRVPEPILPPRLFRNGIFSVSTSVTFILGLTMFGAMIFLPVYLQIVGGASATMSGLLLLPMMVGVLAASIGSGRLVSKYGRYRIYPIVGAVLMTLGMYLLTHLQRDTSYVAFSVFLVVLGLGLGLCMQNLVLAVQNAVDIREMGVATSAVNFFRSIGGAIGAALFGAILNVRLDHWLTVLVPNPGAVDQGDLLGDPQTVQALPAPIRDGVEQAFVNSLHTVFVVGTPIAAVAIVLALMLREVRLRETPAIADELAAAPGGGVHQSATAAVN